VLGRTEETRRRTDRHRSTRHPGPRAPRPVRSARHRPELLRCVATVGHGRSGRAARRRSPAHGAPGSPNPERRSARPRRLPRAGCRHLRRRAPARCVPTRSRAPRASGPEAARTITVTGSWPAPSTRLVRSPRLYRSRGDVLGHDVRFPQEVSRLLVVFIAPSSLETYRPARCSMPSIRSLSGAAASASSSILSARARTEARSSSAVMVLASVLSAATSSVRSFVCRPRSPQLSTGPVRTSASRPACVGLMMSRLQSRWSSNAPGLSSR